MTTIVHAALAAVLSLGLTGVLAGCAPSEGKPAVKDPQAELDARPTSQEITARYEQMQQRIREQLDAELGPFTWGVRSAATESTCSPEFSGLNGTEVTMPRWGFDGGIPDTDWSRAKQIVTDIIAEYGFTTPTLQIDRPGDHETSAADLALGAQFWMGTEVNTLIRVHTGCHRDTAT